MSVNSGTSPHHRQPAGWGPHLITSFLLSAPRELDEEISADLADEVGATTLVWLMLRLWGLGRGAVGCRGLGCQCLERGCQGDGMWEVTKMRTRKSFPSSLGLLSMEGRAEPRLTTNLFFLACVTPGGNN